MKTYRGKITRIGQGDWISNGSGGGKTTVSVFEIGVHTLQKLLISDYMINYVNVGEDVEILVSKGLSQGLITRKYIAGIKVNGKIYKENLGTILFMNFAKIFLYFMLTIPIIMLYQSMFPLIIGIVALVYYIKEIIDFMKF